MWKVRALQIAFLRYYSCFNQITVRAFAYERIYQKWEIAYFGEIQSMLD